MDIFINIQFRLKSGEALSAQLQSREPEIEQEAKDELLGYSYRLADWAKRGWEASDDVPLDSHIGIHSVTINKIAK